MTCLSYITHVATRRCKLIQKHNNPCSRYFHMTHSPSCCSSASRIAAASSHSKATLRLFFNVKRNLHAAVGTPHEIHGRVGRSSDHLVEVKDGDTCAACVHGAQSRAAPKAAVQLLLRVHFPHRCGASLLAASQRVLQLRHRHVDAAHTPGQKGARGDARGLERQPQVQRRRRCRGRLLSFRWLCGIRGRIKKLNRLPVRAATPHDTQGDIGGQRCRLER